MSSTERDGRGGKPFDVITIVGMITMVMRNADEKEGAPNLKAGEC